jgi:prepilin-type N-terminal cleavage/methylation domain-containing protein/prepilin-type processing-associated H-X9-DG protein
MNASQRHRVLGGGAFGRVAFSLVELLVVIAIISILAALRLPVLSRARAAADSAVYKSNLHQIGLGLRLYVDDFKAYPLYPLYVDFFGRANWYNRLEPYTKSHWPNPVGTFSNLSGIYVCPAYVRLGNVRTTGTYGYNVNGTAPSFQKGWGLGLGRDRMIPDDQGITAEGDFLPIRETQVVRPSEMIAVPEAWLMKGLNRPFDANTDMPDTALTFSYSSSSGYGVSMLAPQQLRHNGHFNVFFCDGHQETILAKVIGSRNPEALRRWNNDNQPHANLLPAALP